MDLTAVLEKVVVTLGYTSPKPEQKNAIKKYICSRQKLVVHPSLNQYHDPANPIIVVSSSTKEVSKCVYWIDPQPVSSQRGGSHFVHGILKRCHHCDHCVISFNNRTIKYILDTVNSCEDSH